MGGGPVPRATLSKYCEQCGRRFDVHGAMLGDLDIGLDRVNSVFRYCSTCQRFVGRACCWNPDVLACSVCGPPGTDLSAISPADIKGRKEVAIRRLADLGESVDDLHRVAKTLETRMAVGVPLPEGTWTDAWDAASWLIARADTSRDAVARALWPPPPERARASFEQFHEELAELMKAYLAERASVEEKLMAAGQPSVVSAPSRGTSGLPRGWRAVSQVPALVGSLAAGLFRGWRGVPMPSALVGAAIAVVVVAGGLVVLGRAPETGLLGGQGSPEQTRGTDGGAGAPHASAATPAPAATPTPDGGSEPAAPSVRASLDFDTLRIGALQGANDAITNIVGVNEVVPFPSPFDRSVRMVGSGTHQLCISIPGLEPREVSIAVDLYAESLPFSALELAAVPSDGPATATGIPPELVTSLLPGRWYHLGARWQPGTPGTIEIRDGQGGELISELAPVSEVTPAATFEGVCLSTSGMAADGELMLDNLRVEQ